MGWLNDLTLAAEKVARETHEDVEKILDRWLDGDVK